MNNEKFNYKLRQLVKYFNGYRNGVRKFSDDYNLSQEQVDNLVGELVNHIK